MNKKLAGFMVISVALISMALWEFWGRENLAYDEVLVLKDNKAANVLIEEEDLTVKKIESTSAAALKENDKEWLIGMETSQFVAKNTELRKEYFSKSEYTVGNQTGRYIMCVPEDWMLSFPKSIRRGDKVSFYNGTIKILDAVVIHAFDSSGQEVISKDKNRNTAESVVSRIEIVSTADKLVELSFLAGKGKRFAVLYS